jgi:hypothetical protein
MKTKKIFLVVFSIFFLIYADLHSQTKDQLSKFEATDHILNSLQKDLISSEVKTNLRSPLKTQQKKEKSPFLGAILSGVLPGAGEFYAESYLKGAIFLAAEIGLWTTHIIFNNKGDDQTIFFEGFADQNWDVRKYAQWLINQQFNGYEQINPAEPDRNILRLQINEVERLNFSHTLPNYGDQQYYEVIGKYQNFVAGWADVDISNLSKDPASPHYYGKFKSPMYLGYADERQKANDYYDNASLAVSGVILNHVLSAADAAWTVSVYNKQIRMQTSLKMENVYSYSEQRSKLIPFAHLKINF